MGHANSAAALRYQHATADRDQAIAQALSELAQPAEVVPIARKVVAARDGRAMGRPGRERGAPERAPDLRKRRERATGIEPAFSAWEADVLPLNYARTVVRAA